jgi:hypothetical protein
MNKNKCASKAIEWERAFILFEFQQYLDISNLLEVSLINRYLREKMKKTIFKVIKLNFSNVYNFPEYFTPHRFEIEGENLTELEKSNFKCSRIDPSVAKLASEIDKYSSYFKSLQFNHLDNAGYFVIPIIERFSHLSSLNIHKCYINLSVFNKLMLKLNKLLHLRLYDLKFMKLPSEGHIERETQFPATLKELHLGDLYLSTTNSLNNPYDLLYSYDIQIEEEDYHLPPQRFIEIKKLGLYRYFKDQRYISSLLNLNPQLSTIALPLQFYTIEVAKLLSNSKNIKNMTIDIVNEEQSYSPQIELPCLDSLSSLSVPYMFKEEFPKFYQIISSCPNLTKLDIEVNNFRVELINTLSRKLKHLKILKLIVQGYGESELDFALFSNIEVLEFDNHNRCAIKFKFPSPPMKLKSITILSAALYANNVKFLRESEKSDCCWSFKFKGNAMCCRVKNIL